MLTGKNISDAQIEALRDDMMKLSAESKLAKTLAQQCNLALNLPRGFDRDMWRTRCAELLNVQRSNMSNETLEILRRASR